MDTDEGARYFGEFALGVNPHITSPMLDTLFDEKISGSFHLLTLAASWALWFSIRQRERDQERLSRSEQKHRTIINHAGEAIFLLDRKGRVLEWNKAAERLFGVARRAVLGRPLCEVHLCYGMELDKALDDAEQLNRSLTFE